MKLLIKKEKIILKTRTSSLLKDIEHIVKQLFHQILEQKTTLNKFLRTDIQIMFIYQIAIMLICNYFEEINSKIN